MRSSVIIGAVLGLGFATTLAAGGCGSDKAAFDPNGQDASDIEAGPGFQLDGGDAHACKNLQCQQQQCGGGLETTVSGTVFAPNGKLPLYNAIVYVPNATPAPLTKGATCDVCGAVTGEPLVTALSGSDGTFTLHDVPVGKDIPLVIQVGKWRRQVTIPEVVPCQETKLTDPELTRLPKNQGEGDMPQIALTTGGCDKLGCMLPKIGIDTSEFGTAADGPSKAVHVYLGSGGGGPSGSPSAKTLWSDVNKMKAYDMLILSCECSEQFGSGAGASKNQSDVDAMTDYLHAGGRIFTTDFMYTWYRYTPDADLKSATTIKGGAPPVGNPMNLITSFPKGKALADWMKVVAGSNGSVTADTVFGNLTALDSSKAQDWADSSSPGPRVFTVNVPVGVPAEQQCGRGVHIDAHVNQSGPDTVGTSYPAGCGTPLKPAEHLLAFFFFDLASCIQDDTTAPQPPQVK
jgi:hypothetical protein